MDKMKDLLPDRNEICLLIKNAFSEQFCDEIMLKHNNDFSPANLNYPTSYRNNERQIKDDVVFSKLLFEEIRKYLPDVIEVNGISDKEKGIWNRKGLNERIRICRYSEGQYFNKHLDGVYYQSKQVQSKLTFMIYLNGGNEEFEGGRTLFFRSKEDDQIIGFYQPSKGDLIIFDHNLWHSGEEVRKGDKYILRSDILYQKAEDTNEISLGPFKEGHLGYIWKIVSHDSGYLTAGRDKLIKIWDKDGQKKAELKGHKNSILDMALLSNNVLISCSRDKSIIVWHKINDQDFGMKHELVYHESTVLGVLPLSNNLFVSCGADGRLNLIDVSGKLMESVIAHNEWIWAVAKIKDEVIVSIGEGGLLKIWGVNPFLKVSEVQMGYPLTAIEYDKENSIIYVGGINGIISAFNLKKDLSLHKLFDRKCHIDKIWVIKCDKQRVASGGEDNKVIIWNKRDMKKIKEYYHKNFVQDLILEDDRMISVSYDGEIRELK